MGSIPVSRHQKPQGPQGLSVKRALRLLQNTFLGVGRLMLMPHQEHQRVVVFCWLLPRQALRTYRRVQLQQGLVQAVDTDRKDIRAPFVPYHARS